MTEPLAEDRGPVVVWWRTRVQRDPDGSRLHRIGWATPTGRHRGSFPLRSPHPWLDAATIERSLAAHLEDAFGATVQILPATSDRVAISAEVELLAAGHRIVELDLSSLYGPDVVAGATVQLLGRGHSAVLVFDHHLSTHVRESIAAEMVAELAELDVPTPALEARGWSSTASGRWELLYVQ